VSNILVTGGAGFIGGHLTHHLLAQGHSVTVLDDFSTGTRERVERGGKPDRLRIVEGSILNPEAVVAAVTGCEIIYHLAVQCVRRSIGNPLENHEINATGTLNVLETARRAGVARFVYCSSSEVYGNTSSGLLHEESVCEPMTVYGAAKLVGEYYTKAYMRTYGMDVAIVRPFNAYGPFAHEQGDLAEVLPRFFIRVLNGLPPLIFGDPNNGRDFTYVTEVARGIAAVGECEGLKGDVVNIAHGKLVTVGEVAETVLRVCQRPDIKPVIGQKRPGDVHVLQADTNKAKRLLNYDATIEFEQGVEMYLDWFTRRHPNPATLLEAEGVNWEMPK
jgi:UDP-glucose 4-epimerase